MTPLTAIEEAEFTLFNAATYDLLRKEAQRDDTKIPCWLCMSEEARRDAKQKFAAWLSGAIRTLTPFTVEIAERYVARHFQDKMGDLVTRWKAMELEYKRLREDENNPRAFFA